MRFESNIHLVPYQMCSEIWRPGVNNAPPPLQKTFDFFHLQSELTTHNNGMYVILYDADDAECKFMLSL